MPRHGVLHGILLTTYLLSCASLQDFYLDDGANDARDAVALPRAVNATNPSCLKNASFFRGLMTIDGGGMRCMVAVQILEKVEAAIKKAILNEDGTPKDGNMDILLADYFGGFSGVNCGAWVASYLASKCGKFRCNEILNTRSIADKYGRVPPGSVKGLRVFFETFTTKIYPQRQSRSVLELIKIMKKRGCLVGLSCPIHPVEGYHRVLEQFLGNIIMNDLPASLILPMYDLKRRAVVTIACDSLEKNITQQQLTFIFEGTAHPKDPSRRLVAEMQGFEFYNDKSYSLLDVTQAAGTRVASHEAHRFRALNEQTFELICQDTSLLFNNPTVVALTVFAKMRHRGTSTDFRGISLFSIGTGMVDGSLADRAAAGSIQWSVLSQDFLSIVIHGGSELVQTQVDAFLYAVVGSQFYRTKGYYHHGQYLRVQALASDGTPTGEALMSTDNATYFETLKMIGEDTAKYYEESIDDFVSTFICGRGYEDRSLGEHFIMDRWEEAASIIESLEDD